MLAAVEHVASVVAIGDSAGEITRAFEAYRHVETASDMDDAVYRAARLAAGGIPVLLSPGCASFDWYREYGERGNDFARAVAELAESIAADSSLAVPDSATVTETAYTDLEDDQK